MQTPTFMKDLIARAYSRLLLSGFRPQEVSTVPKLTVVTAADPDGPSTYPKTDDHTLTLSCYATPNLFFMSVAGWKSVDFELEAINTEISHFLGKPGTVSIAQYQNFLNRPEDELKLEILFVALEDELFALKDAALTLAHQHNVALPIDENKLSIMNKAEELTENLGKLGAILEEMLQETFFHIQSFLALICDPAKREIVAPTSPFIYVRNILFSSSKEQIEKSPAKESPEAFHKRRIDRMLGRDGISVQKISIIDTFFLLEEYIYEKSNRFDLLRDTHQTAYANLIKFIDLCAKILKGWILRKQSYSCQLSPYPAFGIANDVSFSPLSLTKEGEETKHKKISRMTRLGSSMSGHPESGTSQSIPKNRSFTLNLGDVLNAEGKQPLLSNSFRLEPKKEILAAETLPQIRASYSESSVANLQKTPRTPPNQRRIIKSDPPPKGSVPVPSPRSTSVLPSPRREQSAKTPRGSNLTPRGSDFWTTSPTSTPIQDELPNSTTKPTV